MLTGARLSDRAEREVIPVARGSGFPIARPISPPGAPSRRFPDGVEVASAPFGPLGGCQHVTDLVNVADRGTGFGRSGDREHGGVLHVLDKHGSSPSGYRSDDRTRTTTGRT